MLDGKQGRFGKRNLSDLMHLKTGERPGAAEAGAADETGLVMDRLMAVVVVLVVGVPDLIWLGQQVSLLRPIVKHMIRTSKDDLRAYMQDVDDHVNRCLEVRNSKSHGKGNFSLRDPLFSQRCDWHWWCHFGVVSLIWRRPAGSFVLGCPRPEPDRHGHQRPRGPHE